VKGMGFLSARHDEAARAQLVDDRVLTERPQVERALGSRRLWRKRGGLCRTATVARRLHDVQKGNWI
jgi:hypothetical protein